jgi:hypothetical protein
MGLSAVASMFIPGPEEIVIGCLVEKSIIYISEVPFFANSAKGVISWAQQIEKYVKEGKRAKFLDKKELDLIVNEGYKHKVKMEIHGPHLKQNPPYKESHISVQPGGPNGPGSKAHLNIPDGYVMPPQP